jgi:hypothetical protein
LIYGTDINYHAVIKFIHDAIKNGVTYKKQ